MAKGLNAAQKKGLLILLGILVLVAGWRWRAKQLSDAPSHVVAGEAQPAASEAQKTVLVELNSADTTLLQSVKGIGPTTARRIVRYRSLIGGFKNTEQLLKVFGITPENFLRIEEQVYVDTTAAAYAALKHSKPQYANDRPSYAKSYPQARSYGQPQWAQKPEQWSSKEAQPAESAENKLVTSNPKPSKSVVIDINTADSLDLVSISGIGGSTARNILKYRSLIYFFNDLEQLSEVWGIRPENLERMLPHLKVGESRAAMPHLKINEMTVDELGRHKYLGWKDAKILVSYRDLHGPFANFESMKKVLALDPNRLEKLQPYLEF